ncbi:MAG: L-threonylcarbamoyladenylate synthase [Patescibacteria group bacterium]
MKTLIVKINPKKPEPAKIKLAVTILKQGGLVAFPTDTVYGLGALATNSAAVKKIYKVKKRSLSSPLPILISKRDDLKKYTFTAPKIKKLINKFWPGPLTIVLKKKKIISSAVTAGKKSVGVRVPANPVALALISALDQPLTVTSANISNKKSSTTAREVKKYLNNKIDLILDGGKTKLGRESTVLDLTTSPPAILRSGAVSVKNLEKYLGKIIKK